MIFPLLICFNLRAEPIRKPAIVKRACDLNKPEFQKKRGSEKGFKSEVSHKIVILTDNGLDCSEVKNNRFNDSVYEKYTRKEMQLLFDKNPKDYITSCESYYASKKIKKGDFECKPPQNILLSFKDIACENKIASAIALVTYEHESVLLEEKSACARINECIEFAAEDELPELNKLAAVACKNKLILPDTGNAPVLIRDSQGFDGKRILELKERESDPNLPEVELKNKGK